MINLQFDARTFENTYSGIANTTLQLYTALHDYYGEDISFNGLFREKLYQELPGFKNNKSILSYKKVFSV